MGDWTKLLNSMGMYDSIRTTTHTQEEHEELLKNQPISTPSPYDPSFPLLPIARRIYAKTIGGGGWGKSKKQQQREDRLNKLRQLQGEDPNVTLPDDEFFDGLVSVVPISAPSSTLFYCDFKYETPEEKRKKQQQTRKDKLENLNNLLG